MGAEAMAGVQGLETAVWGLEPIDVMPVTLLVAMQAAGALVLGAFEDATLVGFAQSFPGIENGRTTMHSHTLAVRDSHTSRGIGWLLKRAQRERVLALGIREITWTFDPLQAANAHFNFAKLGVVCADYRFDFYGGACTSFLLGERTDRLWVRWLLETGRVEARVAPHGSRLDRELELSSVELVGMDSEGRPVEAIDRLDGIDAVSVSIPADINRIRREDPGLANDWREATGRAFRAAFADGLVATEFVRSSSGGSYVLRRGRLDELVDETA